MTQAEQNRLIQDNLGLCYKIAADFRNGYTDFEDLVAEATLSLVKAARSHRYGPEMFPSFASLSIRSDLINLAEREKKHRHIDSIEIDGMNGFGVIAPEASDDSPARVYEWESWGEMGHARAICEWYPEIKAPVFEWAAPETWTELPIVPDDIKELFDSMRLRADRFPSAIIGLKPFEKKLIGACLDGLMSGKIKFETIARLHKMSYRATLVKVHKILRLMREAIAGQDRAARRAKASSKPTAKRRLKSFKIAVAV